MAVTTRYSVAKTARSYDPDGVHTGAELDLEQIWLMVDDLLEAHKDWLPEFLSKTSHERL